MWQVPTRWSHHALPLLEQGGLKAVAWVETVGLVSRHQLLHRLQYYTQLQQTTKFMETLPQTFSHVEKQLTRLTAYNDNTHTPI